MLILLEQNHSRLNGPKRCSDKHRDYASSQAYQYAFDTIRIWLVIVVSFLAISMQIKEYGIGNSTRWQAHTDASIHRRNALSLIDMTKCMINTSVFWNWIIFCIIICLESELNGFKGVQDLTGTIRYDPRNRWFPSSSLLRWQSFPLSTSRRLNNGLFDWHFFYILLIIYWFNQFLCN